MIKYSFFSHYTVAKIIVSFHISVVIIWFRLRCSASLNVFLTAELKPIVWHGMTNIYMCMYALVY